MATRWKGSIALPEGLPQPELEGIEFISSLSGSILLRSLQEKKLFVGAQLRVQAILDSSKVPLWLACGPSFDVQTESETTATILANIFVTQSSRSSSPALEGDEKNENEENENPATYKSTQKALLVRVIYDQPPDDQDSAVITELVLYGIVTQDAPPTENPVVNDDDDTDDENARHTSPATTPPPSSSVSVYALPLSSHLAKERAAHASVKQEPQEPGKAIFLANRKRKIDTVFDGYDKTRAYYATLPPTLRRSWHQRANSIGSQKEDPGLAVADPPKSIFSRSIGPGTTGLDFRKSVIDDGRLQRERSQSILTARFREVSERPTTAKSTGPGNNSSSFRKSTVAPKSQPTVSDSKALQLKPTTSTFADRNKAAVSKIIMASMRLHGFERTRAGQTKIESEEEEYKLIYHGTLRALTISFRKAWSTELIGLKPLKETTEHLMKVFVGGLGLVSSNSDKEGETEYDNPFRNSTFGHARGNRTNLFGSTLSRDETTLVEEGSMFQDESLLGVSQVEVGQLDLSQIDEPQILPSDDD